jgi:hypothetical protein
MSSGRNSASSYNGDKSPAGNSVVLHMVRDAYANYVVQTTLDVVPEQSEERTLLIHELNEHSDELVRCCRCCVLDEVEV